MRFDLFPPDRLIFLVMLIIQVMIYDKFLPINLNLDMNATVGEVKNVLDLDFNMVSHDVLPIILNLGTNDQDGVVKNVAQVVKNVVQVARNGEKIACQGDSYISCNNGFLNVLEHGLNAQDGCNEKVQDGDVSISPKICLPAIRLNVNINSHIDLMNGKNPDASPSMQDDTMGLPEPSCGGTICRNINCRGCPRGACDNIQQ